jgi:hypothetical protein
MKTPKMTRKKLKTRHVQQDQNQRPPNLTFKKTGKKPQTAQS